MYIACTAFFLVGPPASIYSPFIPTSHIWPAWWASNHLLASASSIELQWAECMSVAKKETCREWDCKIYELTLNFKARSYLNLTPVHNRKKPSFSTRSMHCTFPPWIPMLGSFTRCSKHAKPLDNVRSQPVGSVQLCKEPMQQDLVFN